MTRDSESGLLCPPFSRCYILQRSAVVQRGSELGSDLHSNRHAPEMLFRKSREFAMRVRVRVTFVRSAGVLFASIALLFAAQLADSAGKSRIAHRDFGATKAGKMTQLYTMTNEHGADVSITDFGATVVSIRMPNRSGTLGDVILGWDGVSGYEEGTQHFGATIGRYANRIAHGEFSLDGVKYTLAKNNGENTLHGGLLGFDKKMWDVKDVSSSSTPALQFEYLSKDGEENFPGNLSVRVTFTLTNSNELQIVYEARTDKKTVVNLTNHAYFNLAGSGTILDETLMIAADRFTPVDSGQIPTGELRSVARTPFDFRKPTIIGARIEQDDEQLKIGHGYDHNWVLNSGGSAEPTPAAAVTDPRSGRTLEVWTTEPGIQLYTSNFLDGAARGKGGVAYARRSALCLETQHFPDSPNHPAFPTTELLPDAKFKSETIYKFSAK
jgi:aldose 1-epimerase